MSPERILVVLALGAAPLIAAPGPDGLDSREIPVPAIAAPLGPLPGPGELPSHPNLPDLFTANDGTKVATLAQWVHRREELRRILAYYAVGQSPASPGNVEGHELGVESVFGGRVRYRLIRLSFGPKGALSLNIGVFTPAKGGPFPAIVLQGGTPPGAPVLDRLPVLLVNGRRPESMSRKVYEYLASRRPVFAISPAGEGRPAVIILRLLGYDLDGLDTTTRS